MSKTDRLSTNLDKKYAHLRGNDLLNAPVHAIRGMSERDAVALHAGLGVRTIRDLADNTVIQRARILGDHGDTDLRSFSRGIISQHAASALAENLNIRSTRDLLDHPHIRAALEIADDIQPALGATNLTPGQQAFIQSIESKVSSLLSTQLNGTFQVVNYPAGFNYSVTYGAAGYYNPATLEAMDGLLAMTSNGTLSMTGSAFSTMYNRILQAASYQYSNADNQVINSPNVANQAQAILQAAKSDGYPVTDTYAKVIIQAVADTGGGTSVTPQTLAQAGSKLTPLYPSLGPALSNYANQLGPQLAIMNRQAQANAELTAAQSNSQNPTATNGGLQTGASGWYVSYNPLPTNNQVQGGLQGSSSVTISIAASSFSSTSTQFSVEGHTGFTIPIGDFLGIGISGGASYDMSRYTSSSSSLTMSMEYKGIYLFSSMPTALAANNATGWYDNEMLQSIVAGSGDTSVSGFKIPTSSQYNIASTFGPGKTFSRFKTFVISQQPTITMVFSAARSNQLMQDFKQHSSVNVKLFGLFTVGQVDQSYQVSSVQQDAAAGTVTIVLAPPAISGTVPLEAQVAYILGGVASYPPNNI